MALTDSLISAWELNEASGNAVDSHGSSTLTDTNSVGAGTGLVYGNARDFENGSDHYFSAADSAPLSLGADQDFEFEMWVKPETVSAADHLFLSKFKVGAVSNNDCEYRIYVRNTTGEAKLTVGTGSAHIEVTASNFGALTAGNWYHIHAWHDSTANEVGISVNGTANTEAWSSGTQDQDGVFYLGAQFNDLVGDGLFDGLMGPVRFWKRTLSGAERTELYNGGAGLTYAALSASGTSIPVFMNHYAMQRAA